MKHVVLFSGGANSTLVALQVSRNHPNDTILLHTPTHAEHPDSDRFREDAAKLIGLPITTRSSGFDLWSLIEDQNCLPSHFIPFCTRILKLEPLDKYLSQLDDDFTIYVGYDKDEWRRIQKQASRFAIKGYKSSYPLFDQGVTNCEAKRAIRGAGLRLPDPYEHINHNNCLPCFKGGVGHFWAVWRFYPEYFSKAVEQEHNIGHTVFKDNGSLDELSMKWANGERPRSATEDGIPCLCSY